MTATIQIPSKEKWEFDEEVTQVFDDMLRRSIPQYEVMRNAVADIAERFARTGFFVVDLGCSRGETISQLLAQIGGYYHYVGVDVSQPMLQIARDRFKSYDTGIVRIEECDLRREYPLVKQACVTLSILTLQFLPIEYRQKLISNVYKTTCEGGAFILVEKVLGKTTQIDSLMVDLYYKLKQENKYSAYEIERKRLALEGVLVPVTAGWNEELLCSAGFQKVDCFWRWMNFAGWVAIK